MKSTKTLLRKGRILLPQVALIATLVSCSKQDLQEDSLQSDATAVQVQNESLALLSSNPRIMFEETFEGTLWSGMDISQQWGTSYGFQVASTPVYAGSKSGRFELRDTDPEVNSGTRTEVKFPEATNMNRWYAFSAYFPSADYQYDSEEEIINQWHQGGGVSPSIALQTRYDKFVLDVRNDPDVKTKIDLGAITKDKWLNFVIHIKHSNGSDGLIEIWQNGVKILTKNGGNSYAGSVYDSPKWKLGIYKDDWNGSQTTDTKKRVVYYDNIRLGNENATYSDMTSVASSSTTTTTTPTAPTTSDPISSTAPSTGTTTGGSGFTLVNAGTDQDVMAITNGATINYGSLGLSRVNFRANISAASVKLELSGPVSHSYVDNSTPYALFGDDGSGNYYYGGYNPLPSGTYTLKATPYSGYKASGTAGTPTTVTFTISNSTSTSTSTTTTTTAPTSSTSTTTSGSTSTTTTGSGSFTLVDANLDRDVKTIVNGETISLSARGLSKLNFRANMSAVSVKLEISGPISRTYVDDANPYALFGDDNSGNYYYGGYNPLPSGTYTLKATPYSGYKASGTAGTPVSITFTIAP